ncbi:hypothetical protein LVD15_22030 [Fulvivirga maritima]|uniref:hypothetical protein n=1 Tax=Fulvivirga maritima TaxID=2904247 RepID=UPI001F2AAF19|nr:hypothetical protein [Fulvivirga maritima]UII25953.1 hypothetical protein LVD15_22030 [Fulvivirga maritima]
MTKDELKDYLNNVLIGIHENIKEVRDRKGWAEEKEILHIETKLLTYNEVLQIFKFTAKEMGLPEKELGI